MPSAIRESAYASSYQGYFPVLGIANNSVSADTAVS